MMRAHLSIATTWRHGKFDIIYQLFTTGAWLPPAVSDAK
jgi:hypothetical protein